MVSNLLIVPIYRSIHRTYLLRKSLIMLTNFLVVAIDSLTALGLKLLNLAPQLRGGHTSSQASLHKLALTWPVVLPDSVDAERGIYAV